MTEARYSSAAAGREGVDDLGYTAAMPFLFDILNPQGGGNAVLVCDHASNWIPEEFDGLGLPPAVLERHIGWDIGAADVTRRLSALLDAPAVLNRVSRLVIDPNRPLGHPESILAESDGVTVPGNRALPVDETRRRAERYFAPYQQAVADTVAAARKRGVVPALISVHSFVAEMRGFRRPWQIGLLHAADRRLTDALLAALAAADASLTIGDNEPYSGASDARNTVREHGEKAGLPNVTIELRQDLIATREDAEAWAERLAAALAGPLNDPSLLRIERFPGPAESVG